MFLHQGYVQRTAHHTTLLAELQQRLDVVRAGGGASWCMRYPMFGSFDSFARKLRCYVKLRCYIKLMSS